MSTLRSKLRHPGFIVVLCLPGILMFGLPFYKPVDLPNFLLFLGRLHPLILHFPIVLAVLAFVFEVGRSLRLLRVPNTFVFMILVTAAYSSLASAGAGFFLYASGDYSGQLIEQHFRGGVLTVFICFTTLWLFSIYWNSKRFYPLYFGALAVSNISIVYTSHQGGSVTHGQDFLTEYLELMTQESGVEEIKPAGEMLVYEDMIAQIFEVKCISCHNAQRTKGALVMSSYEEMFKRGESNLPSITAGQPKKSEVYNRVVLPPDHQDRMPPEGKTPLTSNEISLLKFWIESGAKEKQKVENEYSNKKIAPIIDALLPALTQYRRKTQIAKLRAKSLQNELKSLASRLSVIIQKDSTSDENSFIVSMSFPPAPLSNAQFELLLPYSVVFSKASLVSSGIDDAGLYHVGQMINLEKLYLQKTRIDGSGLIHLQKLKKLKVLNLSFTHVDDKAAIDLLKIPNLQEVYLYRTNTSKEVLDALQKNKPGLKIYLQEGPYF